jgi:prepilin-type N-terminal cleavage/methylation domain-containing protein
VKSGFVSPKWSVGRGAGLRAHGGRARRGGFSLVELIAVMVVLAIMSAAALVSVGQQPRARREAAVMSVLRDVTYARQRAMTTGVRTWVVFSTTAPASMTVLTELATAPGRGGAITVTDPANNSPFVRRFNTQELTGLTLTSATFQLNSGTSWSEIGFNRRGEPILTNGSVMTFSDGRVVFNNGWEVRVNSWTGLPYRHFTGGPG